MLAGLPQMCAGELAGCSSGVNLALDGPGGGTWALRPGEPWWTVEDGADPSLPDGEQHTPRLRLVGDEALGLAGRR